MHRFHSPQVCQGGRSKPEAVTGWGRGDSQWLGVGRVASHRSRNSFIDLLNKHAISWALGTLNVVLKRQEEIPDFVKIPDFWWVSHICISK